MKNYFKMMATLLRSVPCAATVTFVLAVIVMNFLSRITLVNLPWLALNAGILVSWVAFLILDIFVKHFGARAANILSLLAITANLICSLFCVVLSRLFKLSALDMVVGGQWSILLASTVAYIISAVSNNYTNIFVGSFFRKNPDGKSAYAARSFLSTLFSQIIDNFIFLFLAFMVLPLVPGAFPVRWTFSQCVSASVLCAFFELFTEIVFSPIGYNINKKWKNNGVGKEYIEKYCQKA